MEFADAIEFEPTTPEFILSLFQDSFQQAQAAHEAEPDFELTINSTIAEWRDALLDDLFSWRSFGNGINNWFGIAIPRSEWKRALTPSKRRTLRDVCELIARYATVPKLRPVAVFGHPCRPAGAFFAIVQLLERDGADVDEISPSTPLFPFTRRHYRTFVGPIAWLAPGTLPTPQISSLALSLCSYLLVACGVMTLAGQWVSPWLTIIGAPGILLAYIGSFVAAACGPDKVEFPGLVTFRDLANKLAVQRPISPPAT